MTTVFAKVLSKLTGVTGTGGNRKARCPAHDDKVASLSTTEGDDGRVLLHCHAGCKPEAILSAIGLTLADLFSAKKKQREIIATYDYRTADGELVYQACRYDTTPKTFSQRQPNGAGGWVWKGPSKTARVPYRLPELAGRALAIVCEGERDVDTLGAIGIPATTNIGGAGKWGSQETRCLKAAGVKQVIILPDNDDAGRQHAEQVAMSVKAAGLGVRVIELPELAIHGDVSDWLAAGHTKADLEALIAATPPQTSAAIASRTLQLTRASEIVIHPVRWLWQDRVALGAFSLMGGREAVGKTICTYTLAASITRGTLPGAYKGNPRAVIIAATEDSWTHTIVPRLMAAGADLDRIYRVDVVTAEGTDTSLSLPRDLVALEHVVRQVGAALTILDPLLSRLDATLDSHKDAEVRLALEPLVALATKTDCAVLGLIHVNKSTSGDALTTLMGSRAFAAVARSVLYVMVDPDNEQIRLLGQAKNNLGRIDLATLSFQIVGVKVADTTEGPIWTGRLEWLGETDRSIKDVMVSAAETVGDKTATTEAAGWLQDFMVGQNEAVDSAIIKREGGKAGHSKDALRRAKQRLGVGSVTSGFPRRAYWSLPSKPSHQWAQPPGETSTTALTASTASTASTALTEPQWTQSAQSAQSIDAPQDVALTGAREQAADKEDQWTVR